jgi:CubicO group peptidase (beta-lactamase class C family)
VLKPYEGNSTMTRHDSEPRQVFSVGRLPVVLLAAAVLTAPQSAVPTASSGSWAQAEVPAWVAYPDEEWRTLTPQEAGVRDVEAWNRWVEATKKSSRGASFQGEDHSGVQWGVAITRGGYLIQSFGDPDYKFQTASLGKCFTMACLQLAIDEGLIKSADDSIKDYWTGEGQLNAKHKYLDEGFHVFLTFHHLKSHRGAFPITNGWSWKAGKNYEMPAPEWAKWTGDPDHDNYAHARPGTVASVYSSGGYWRLAQALTAVWKKDLKQVLDERIMSQIGIPADRWDWTPGQVVHDNRDWYPRMPGYGQFLDPPYTIDDQTVRGGPGWVVMSAKDLARWGLLVASGGHWKGKRLIPSIQGHGGGNSSDVGGIGGEVVGSWGKVTSTFDQGSIPWKLFADPPMPQQRQQTDADLAAVAEAGLTSICASGLGRRTETPGKGQFERQP